MNFSWCLSANTIDIKNILMQKNIQENTTCSEIRIHMIFLKHKIDRENRNERERKMSFSYNFFITRNIMTLTFLIHLNYRYCE